MFQALASQSNWISTLSNWALGTTGVYVGLLIANFDALARRLPAGSLVPGFWFALISAVFGIVIQALWGMIQFLVSVENQMWTVVLPEVGKPGIDLERVLNLAVDEFVNSRPWPFRKLAKWGSEKGRKDIVLVTKNAATFAQITFAFLIIQYVLLGIAIFWPLGALTTRPSSTTIAPAQESSTTTATPAATPTLRSPSQTPTPKPTQKATATASGPSNP
jgi:hypothetical protein